MARVEGMSELEENKATAVFGRLRKRKEIDRVYAVGVRIRELPLTPERVWRAINNATTQQSAQ